jgi:hypothetical protein
MASNEVCESIEKAALEKVFQEWRQRLVKYVVEVMGW